MPIHTAAASFPLFARNHHSLQAQVEDRASGWVKHISNRGWSWLQWRKNISHIRPHLSSPGILLVWRTLSENCRTQYFWTIPVLKKFIRKLSSSLRPSNHYNSYFFWGLLKSLSQYLYAPGIWFMSHPLDWTVTTQIFLSKYFCLPDTQSLDQVLNNHAQPDVF